ncbi:MAG: hypothetical protein R3D65_13585 [Zhengella sp.]|uniref:hypothetical protein n=1 Tax=Zhengella sp. TaxID=2282762 RepID=UPI001DD1EADE|nr:hypothetical protein [Notoacmeibacter sp.]MCC0027630.1 hypothetical protein [Brucellaceae bacterium]
MKESWKPAVAALVILLGFGLVANFMPNIMLWIGQRSPVVAGIFAILFVLAFFGVFWLRARAQRKRDGEG